MSDQGLTSNISSIGEYSLSIWYLEALFGTDSFSGRRNYSGSDEYFQDHGTEKWKSLNKISNLTFEQLRHMNFTMAEKPSGVFGKKFGKFHETI